MYGFDKKGIQASRWNIKITMYSLEMHIYVTETKHNLYLTICIKIELERSNFYWLSIILIS